MRVAAQHLHRPRRRSAVDLVGHLTGVQAQVLSAAALALRARTKGLPPEHVDEARLSDRSIVLAWAMRGTLHLVTAEDHGWLVPLVTTPRVANAYRRLGQEGVPRGQPPKALRLIERMLEREGPSTRTEIAERLRRRGIHVEGQAIAHLMWLAACEGVVCFGPDRGRDQTFVLTRDWLGPPIHLDPNASLAELAVRYLTSHGPAQPADLAQWAGIGLTDARRAWGLIEDRLIQTTSTRGDRWSLRGRRQQAPPGVVRLLPSFDEYLLGWKDRDLVASTEDWRKINRGGGWLHPVILADGKAVGTWSSSRTPNGPHVETFPFTKLSPAVRRAVSPEADEVAAFLAMG